MQRSDGRSPPQRTRPEGGGPCIDRPINRWVSVYVGFGGVVWFRNLQDSTLERPARQVTTRGPPCGLSSGPTPELRGVCRSGFQSTSHGRGWNGQARAAVTWGLKAWFGYRLLLDTYNTHNRHFIDFSAAHGSLGLHGHASTGQRRYTHGIDSDMHATDRTYYNLLTWPPLSVVIRR